MLIDDIRQYASESADAGDFDAVAKTLSEKTVVVRVGKVGSKATLSAIVNGGHDANAVIAAMRSVPMSSELLDTLTVSGVDWDDDLTKYVMGGLVAAGKIDAAVVTIVQGLATRKEAPAGRTVTADECREAWSVDLVNAKRESLQQRFDEIKNQIGTPEQPLAVVALRTIANEMAGE